MTAPKRQEVRRRWRDYRTPNGGRPVYDYIHGLNDDEHVAAIIAAMAEVRQKGNVAARHVEGSIYEVKADVEGGVIYRVLYANVGQKSNILLSLVAFQKKTQKTPKSVKDLAKRRLSIWLRQGEKKRKARAKQAKKQARRKT